MSLNPIVKLPLGVVGPIVAISLAVGGSLIAGKVSSARSEERLSAQETLLSENRADVKDLKKGMEQQALKQQSLDDRLELLQETLDRIETYLHMRAPPNRGWGPDDSH